MESPLGQMRVVILTPDAREYHSFSNHELKIGERVILVKEGVGREHEVVRQGKTTVGLESVPVYACATVDRDLQAIAIYLD